MPPKRPTATNKDDVFARRIEKLEKQVALLMNNKILTAPLYDSADLPPEGVEGQMALAGGSAWGFINGVWTQLGGGGTPAFIARGPGATTAGTDTVLTVSDFAGDAPFQYDSVNDRVEIATPGLYGIYTRLTITVASENGRLDIFSKDANNVVAATAGYHSAYGNLMSHTSDTYNGMTSVAQPDMAMLTFWNFGETGADFEDFPLYPIYINPVFVTGTSPATVNNFGMIGWRIRDHFPGLTDA